MPDALAPIPIPLEFLTAIGRVVVNWSQLEGILDLVLIKQMGGTVYDQRFHAVFAQMQVQAKVETLQSFSRILLSGGDEAAQERFTTHIFPKLTDLQVKRNWIAHTKWVTENDRIFRSRISAKGKVKITEHPVSLAEINGIADEILKLSAEVWAMATFPELRERNST